MDHAECIKVIEKAAREGATELDLSSKRLTALPAEIGQLSGLTDLDLRGNQLSSLPAEIGQLSGLTNLSLSFN